MHVHAEVFDGASPADLVAAFEGRTVTGAHRKGKQLWLTLSGDGLQPLMHFGALGRVQLRASASASRLACMRSLRLCAVAAVHEHKQVLVSCGTLLCLLHVCAQA